MLKKQVSDEEADIKKLNTQLDGRKTTFEEARKAVNEMNAPKDTKKRIQASIEATIIERNTAHKIVEYVQLQLTEALNKAKTSKHSLKKAKAKLEKVCEDFLEEWKRSHEGLAFLGKMASNSYCLAVRETKGRLKGMLAGSNSSMNWHDFKVEFDRRVAEEQKKDAVKASIASKIADATSQSAVVAAEVHILQASITAEGAPRSCSQLQGGQS